MHVHGISVIQTSEVEKQIFDTIYTVRIQGLNHMIFERIFVVVEPLAKGCPRGSLNSREIVRMEMYVWNSESQNNQTRSTSQGFTRSQLG